MHDHVWVGIYTSKSKSIYVTWLGPEAHKDPWPGDMRRFQLLTEFQDYWQSEIETQGTVFTVATCNHSRDSIAALAWLDEQTGVTLEEFNLDEVAWTFHREVVTHNVPEPYRRSYILAPSALHRNRAWQFAQKVFDRTEKVQQQLLELQDSLRQLIVTLPCELPRNYHMCPF